MLYIDRSTYGSYWQQDGKIKHWNRSVSWQKFLCVCCNGLSGFIDKKLKLIWTICQQQANVIEFDILIPRYHASQLVICNIEYWFLFLFLMKGWKGEKIPNKHIPFGLHRYDCRCRSIVDCVWLIEFLLIILDFD